MSQNMMTSPLNLISKQTKVSEKVTRGGVNESQSKFLEGT
jgi:hypothetical protein